jgi:hypothetical protein
MFFIFLGHGRNRSARNKRVFKFRSSRPELRHIHHTYLIFAKGFYLDKRSRERQIYEYVFKKCQRPETNLAPHSPQQLLNPPITLSCDYFWRTDARDGAALN